IEEVSSESWPVVRDADELHDALLTLMVLPPVPEWEEFFRQLDQAHRVKVIERGGSKFWAAAERAVILDSEEGTFATVRGWMESTGPMTVTQLANRLALSRDVVESAMTKLEAAG